MDIIRAKTLDLFQTCSVTESRKANSILNQKEALAGKTLLSSFPQRIVLELTNQCNLNCKSCGRNAATFKPTYFDYEWLKLFEPILSKVEEVTLMGWGEPTVHPHFNKFLEWAFEHGLRKYFCTNGMRLEELFDDIFRYHVDIIAVSLDGYDQETNYTIRRGVNFNKIISQLKRIVEYKKENCLSFPYINFVFTAMKQNLNQLPKMIDLAEEVGIDEVKVVFFTAMSEEMRDETLWDEKEWVSSVFSETIERAKKKDIRIKLPYLQCEDPAGDDYHKTCHCGWRDLFLGSDGYVRPCMSTSKKLISVKDCSDIYELWNCNLYQKHRTIVNDQLHMDETCKLCYQSSFANWNRKESFIQIGKSFAPEWE